MKINKPLADQAYKVVVARHKAEIKADLRTIYKTLELLLMRGVSESDLIEVLRHDHWENKLAKRTQETPPWETA